MKDSELDGIYTAYFTGTHGQSLAMIIFREGVILGSDIGGGQYDGSYVLDENRKIVNIDLEFKGLAGELTITGVAATDTPITSIVRFQLPVPIRSEQIHRIETPIGVINARFELMRNL